MTVDYQTGEIVEPLSAMEQSALTLAETKIERGLTSFIEVGEALSEVRDSRLYREHFGTFEAYCRDRWGITDRRARQMIDAAAVVGELPTGTTVPINEGQVRELRGLDPEDAAEVMQTAEEISDGKITASTIRQARSIVFDQPDGAEEADLLADSYGDVAEEDFKAAITSAREEGDLSRDNVVSHLPPARTTAPEIDGKTYTPPRRTPRPVAERTLAAIQSQAAKAARDAQALTPDQIRRVRAEAGHVVASLRDSIEVLQHLVNSLDKENQ